MYINNIFDLASLYNCEETLLAYLQSKGLVLENKSCDYCGSNCAIYREFKEFNGIRQKKITVTAKDTLIFGLDAIRKTVIISIIRLGKTLSSHIPNWISLLSILQICWFFVANTPVTECAKFLSISRDVAAHWYSVARDVCIQFCLEQTHQIGKLGCNLKINLFFLCVLTLGLLVRL